MPFVHRLLLMSDSEVESELQSQVGVAGTVMPDYLALMMGDVAMTPDLGPLAPHHFDDRTCFPTCMRTWSQGRSRLLATLDVWSNNKVLETKSVASLGIDNVLIALPFVQAVFQRYGYTAVIEPHKTKQSGSHGRNHVRFVVNSRRHKAKAGWGGYVYHGAEWTVGKPLLYRTSIKFDKEHAAQMHLGRFVVQLISAAYLQGCPPDPCTARAARDDFERRVLGHTCRQVTILVPRYGVPAGTVADVECGDEKNHGLKVWAKVDTKADKFVTLLFKDKGTFWQWRDNVVERMPGLTGTILGGVLGQQGGQSCTALVNGAPVLLSVDREPGGPLVLKGAKHRGQPVVGFEVKAGTWADGLQGGLRAMLPRWAVQQPGVAEVWAITSAVVDDGCLVSLILHDGRLLEIPPDKRSMSVKFEQECATLACAPIDQHLHRDEPFLHLGQSMGLHDHLLAPTTSQTQQLLVMFHRLLRSGIRSPGPAVQCNAPLLAIPWWCAVQCWNPRRPLLSFGILWNPHQWYSAHGRTSRQCHSSQCRTSRGRLWSWRFGSVSSCRASVYCTPPGRRRHIRRRPSRGQARRQRLDQVGSHSHGAASEKVQRQSKKSQHQKRRHPQHC